MAVLKIIHVGKQEMAAGVLNMVGDVWRWRTARQALGRAVMVEEAAA